MDYPQHPIFAKRDEIVAQIEAEPGQIRKVYTDEPGNVTELHMPYVEIEYSGDEPGQFECLGTDQGREAQFSARVVDMREAMAGNGTAGEGAMTARYWLERLLVHRFKAQLLDTVQDQDDTGRRPAYQTRVNFLVDMTYPLPAMPDIE